VAIAYESGIDRTLIRENLGLSVDERFNRLEKLQEFARQLKQSGSP
jgi:hypothetical protein